VAGLWGWSSHPEWPQKKKKKKKNGRMGLAFGGGRTTPLGPGRGFGHPLRPVGGGRSHPRALGGGPATPKIPNPLHDLFFFFFFGLLGWLSHPQRPGGGFGHPHTAGMGWPATPWPKMGWSGHPIFWARGGCSHPDFFPLLFFFFLNFFISKP
jgi:hypothetical protein